MKARPILFSAPMVRAILDGRKTQTRRVVAATNTLADGNRVDKHEFATIDMNRVEHVKRDTIGAYVVASYGLGAWSAVLRPGWQPGDRLWVRESWAHDAGSLEQCRASHEDAMGSGNFGPYYRATEVAPDTLHWRPSIFMPRWASRITLEITDVRVERLQDISEVDAIREGCELVCMRPTGDDDGSAIHGPDGYIALWESINGPGSWDKNPWVWIVEFKRVTA